MIYSDSESAWIAFVAAESVYREAMGELRRFDMEGLLRVALSRLDWRRQALAVIKVSDWSLAERLLPELLQLSSVSHSLLAEVRQCILNVPREILLGRTPGFVDLIIADADSDYESYRRTAELLRIIEDDSQLRVLVGAAIRSSDPDIQEVAEDFG